MLVNETVQTKLPKLNSKFSVEWLVKSDSDPVPEDCNDKMSSSSSLESPHELNRDVSPALSIDRKSDIVGYPESPIPMKPELMQHSSCYRRTDPHVTADPKANYFNQKSMPVGHIGALPTHQNPMLPHYPMTMPVPLAAVQHHQQLLNSQLQMAAALNYQYNASIQPQATHFNQIFSNNFHRTSYQMHRFPYGYSSGKLKTFNVIISFFLLQ